MSSAWFWHAGKQNDAWGFVVEHASKQELNLHSALWMWWWERLQRLCMRQVLWWMWMWWGRVETMGMWRSPTGPHVLHCWIRVLLGNVSLRNEWRYLVLVCEHDHGIE